MNFLKDINSTKRLYLQLEAYQKTFHLEDINSLLEKPAYHLEQINIDDLDLSLFKISNNLRLGNRLEFFFEFLVNQSKNDRIIEKNIQIIENKITLGELDFILENKNHRTLQHIETATKFYLFDTNLKEWIGPNRTDSFFEKANKLKSKQFPLLFHQRTQEVFKERGVNLQNIEQCIHFKAQLFVPILFDVATLANVFKLNINGVYYNEAQFLNLKNKGYEYFIPEKQDWLVNPKHGEVWFTFEIVLQSVLLHFKDNKNPLLWIKKSDKEFEKAFVVDWKD